MEINSFIQSFADTFSLILDLFNDKREFTLVRWDSNSYFSTFNNPTDQYTFSSKYDLSKIEIFYKIPIIKDSYFRYSKQFTKNEYNTISTYLASHEYGHTLFCDSTFTLKILFEHLIVLPNGFNFLFLVVLFSEFMADIYARSIFPKHPEPISSLFLNSRRFKEMVRYIYLYQFPWVPPPPDDPRLYDSYKFEFVELIRLYVFGRWESLKKRYATHPIRIFLNFCERIFTVFVDILVRTNRITIIKNFLIDLAKILDKISLKDVLCCYINETSLNRIKISEI